MKYFFTAQVYLELQLNQDALRCYEKLRTTHFACSTYVMAQLALAYHNIRGICPISGYFAYMCLSLQSIMSRIKWLFRLCGGGYVFVLSVFSKERFASATISESMLFGDWLNEE